MKRIALLLLMAVTVLVPAGRLLADDKIHVVTTIPDLADMTRHIGGDLVEVTSLATGVEDIHAVPMKPSFAVAAEPRRRRRARSGSRPSTPSCRRCSRRRAIPRILRDTPGYIDCSVYVTPLEVPTRIDRVARRSAPDGQPPHQPRSGARQGHGARDRRRARRASTRSTPPSSRRTSTRTSPSSTPRSRAGRRRRRRSRARSW